MGQGDNGLVQQLLSDASGVSDGRQRLFDAIEHLDDDASRNLTEALPGVFEQDHDLAIGLLQNLLVHHRFNSAFQGFYDYLKGIRDRDPGLAFDVAEVLINPDSPASNKVIKVMSSDLVSWAECDANRAASMADRIYRLGSATSSRWGLIFENYEQLIDQAAQQECRPNPFLAVVSEPAQGGSNFHYEFFVYLENQDDGRIFRRILNAGDEGAEFVNGFLSRVVYSDDSYRNIAFKYLASQFEMLAAHDEEWAFTIMEQVFSAHEMSEKGQANNSESFTLPSTDEYDACRRAVIKQLPAMIDRNVDLTFRFAHGALKDPLYRWESHFSEAFDQFVEASPDQAEALFLRMVEAVQPGRSEMLKDAIVALSKGPNDLSHALESYAAKADENGLQVVLGAIQSDEITFSSQEAKRASVGVLAGALEQLNQGAEALLRQKPVVDEMTKGADEIAKRMASVRAEWIISTEVQGYLSSFLKDLDRDARESWPSCDCG